MSEYSKLTDAESEKVWEISPHNKVEGSGISTHKTHRLKLNRWDSLDRPKMSAFNYDNLIIDAYFDKLSEILHDYTDTININNRTLSNLTIDIDKIKSDITQTTSDMNVLTASIDDIKNKFTNVNGEIHTLNDKVNDLTSKHDNDMDGLHGEVNSINSQINDIEDKLNNEYINKLREVENTTNNNEVIIQRHTNSISVMDTSIRDLDDRVHDIEELTTVRNIASEGRPSTVLISTTGTEVTSSIHIDTTVRNIFYRLQDDYRNYNVVEDLIDVSALTKILNKVFINIKTDIYRLDQRINSIVTTMEQRLNTMSADISRISNDVTALQNSAVNADNVKALIAEWMQDVTNVNTIYRLNELITSGENISNTYDEYNEEMSSDRGVD